MWIYEYTKGVKSGWDDSEKRTCSTIYWYIFFNPLKTIWFCYNTHFTWTPARVYSGLVFGGWTVSVLTHRFISSATSVSSSRWNWYLDWKGVAKFCHEKYGKSRNLQKGHIWNSFPVFDLYYIILSCYVSHEEKFLFEAIFINSQSDIYFILWAFTRSLYCGLCRTGVDSP